MVRGGAQDQQGGAQGAARTLSQVWRETAEKDTTKQKGTQHKNSMMDFFLLPLTDLLPGVVLLIPQDVLQITSSCKPPVKSSAAESVVTIHRYDRDKRNRTLTFNLYLFQVGGCCFTILTSHAPARGGHLKYCTRLKYLV